ncbi:hypothetical protein [Alteromonas sp. a30]|nr:hypothetical protein [Alteromonas sp. a30]
MEDGAEKFRELDQFKEHILSLGSNESSHHAKIINLREFRS